MSHSEGPPSGASWRWVYRDTPKSISGESISFETQQSAEDWMGANWESLLHDGHLAASLMNGDEELYTMKLSAE